MDRIEKLCLEKGLRMTGQRRVIFPLPQAGRARAVLEALRAHMQAQRFRAVIDRHYALDAIAEAYAYVETGEKTGIVVIDIVAR